MRLPEIPRFVVFVIALAIAGCEFFSYGEEFRIPGERISVLRMERSLEKDRRVADLEVRLPRPVAKLSWPQAGGSSAHVQHHIELPSGLREVWRTNIGEGSRSTMRLLATPVIGDGKAFVMDVESQIRAIRTATGDVMWEYDLRVPDDEDESFGGGIAYENGTLYVSTGFADVVSLDAETGKEHWRKRMSGPMRAAPSVADGRVYVVTIDNQLFALNGKTGEHLWSHAGFSEIAGLLGGASPAIAAGAVVVPYSSGEIFALRVQNGRALWSDNLSSSQRLDALSTLADIRGMPVIDRGTVYAISHSGRMVAIDLRSGTRAWEKPIGGVEMPWVVGEFIYLLTNESQLVCLTRRGGRVRWVRDLPQFEGLNDRDDPIKWSGPTLGGDRLIITGSHGDVWSVSPYTGKILGRIDLSEEIFLPPVIADGTLYFLTEVGDLIAMR